MPLVRTVTLAATASLVLAGCAGVPVAVSVASLYVDTVLFRRTEKSAGDHVMSAVADRDCGLMNIVRHGRLCEDAPPPPLLVAVMREVKGAPLDGTEPADGSAPPPAPPAAEVQVATAPGTGTVSDADPPDAALPAAPAAPPDATAPTAGTRTVVVAAADRSKPSAVLLNGAAAGSDPGRLLVVVGSFTRRDQAEEHRRRFDGTADTAIVEAVVDGRTRFRVALRPADRTEALRQLRHARAGGVADAWLLPWPHALPGVSALAALPSPIRLDPM